MTLSRFLHLAMFPSRLTVIKEQLSLRGSRLQLKSLLMCGKAGYIFEVDLGTS